MLHYSLWKKIFILAICALACIFALPNILPQNISDNVNIPLQRVNLGLDLQGGGHLLLKVETDEVVGEFIASTIHAIRRDLRSRRIGITDLKIDADKASFRLRDKSKLEAAENILNNHTQYLTRNINRDNARILLEMRPEAMIERNDHVMMQTLEVVRRRIDALGTKEPTIQRQGAERIIVQVPGVQDPKQLKRVLGQTAKMTFHFVAERYPPGSVIPANIPNNLSVYPDNSHADQQYVLENEVIVSGDQLIDAQATINENNQPVVSFRFDTAGAREFGVATQKNIGRYLAILLDGKVVSAPTIRAAILGGSGVIEGGFSVAQANETATLLRAGALPAPLSILEERSVGPGLGQDSIDAGTLAIIIGFIAVLIYMGLSYGLFGLMANVALLVNIVVMIAALSLLQATLTLPGIAGIVLTVGMAVDANVLIFERIREEIARDRPLINAVETGYSRAITTIIDSNLTTLFAALCLFALGSGPIKGFAVTLSIGIVSSMFSAIMITRWMVGYWVLSRKSKTLIL